ncbi:hypothetical protein EIP91_002567 [Steccherinum ochraceum]|uniref:XPG-I domain-containing protein n=1 Tax=Steccherinum ochraceum TaxID=92696 RepID=A0A4R0RFI7_9APHY|nr:hypothetical protein EIP91_002567 [Steccherinum ochraceum]
MTVKKLWETIKGAKQTVSVKELALDHVFEQLNKTGTGPAKPLAIGVDISLWLHHFQARFAAGHLQSGYCPEVRGLFLRLAIYFNLAVHLVLVEDGSQRPAYKREKEVRTCPHWLTEAAREISESMGFTWHVAPGEAEAELARLNALGLIQAVLTDDGDAWLFGARTVLRNPDECNKRSNADMKTSMYKVTAVEETLTGGRSTVPFKAALLLFVLLCGCDYSTKGLEGCGAATSLGLISYHDLVEPLLTFFRRLWHADDPTIISTLLAWRTRLITYLSEDPLRNLKYRQPKVASKVPKDFPQIEVINSLVHPVVSSDATLRTKFRDLQRGVKFLNMDVPRLVGVLQDLLKLKTDGELRKQMGRANVWQGMGLRQLLDHIGERNTQSNTRKTTVLTSTRFRNASQSQSKRPSLGKRGQLKKMGGWTHTRVDVTYRFAGSASARPVTEHAETVWLPDQAVQRAEQRFVDHISLPLVAPSVASCRCRSAASGEPMAGPSNHRTRETIDLTGEDETVIDLTSDD